jgi:hypothetical protein
VPPSIDFDNDAFRVTGKISDVTANSNLATEMRARRGKSVAQMPPELPLGFGRSGSHRAGEPTLRWHNGAIALGPNSRLIVCGHVIAPLPLPPPPAPPHKGRGADRVCGVLRFTSTSLASVCSLHRHDIPNFVSRLAGIPEKCRMDCRLYRAVCRLGLRSDECIAAIPLPA